MKETAWGIKLGGKIKYNIPSTRMMGDLYYVLSNESKSPATFHLSSYLTIENLYR